MQSLYLQEVQLEKAVKRRGLRKMVYEFSLQMALAEHITLLKAPVEDKWKSSLAKRGLAGDAVLKMLSTGLSAVSFD